MRWEFIMSLFAMHALLKNAAGMPLNRIMWIGKMSQAKNDHYKFRNKHKDASNKYGLRKSVATSRKMPWVGKQTVGEPM